MFALVLGVLVVGPAQGAEPPRRDGTVPAERAPLPDPTRAKQVSLEELLAFADANAPRLLVSRSTRGLADAARVAASPLLPANPELATGVGPRYGISGVGVDADVALSQRLYVAGERGRRRHLRRQV